MLLSFTLISSNLVGAAIAFAIANFVIPSGVDDPATVRLANVIAVAIYLPVALVIGVIWGGRRAEPVRSFLREEREPTAEERRAVLLAPLRVTKVVGALWGGAVVLFVVLNPPSRSSSGSTSRRPWRWAASPPARSPTC